MREGEACNIQHTALTVLWSIFAVLSVFSFFFCLHRLLRSLFRESAARALESSVRSPKHVPEKQGDTMSRCSACAQVAISSVTVRQLTLAVLISVAAAVLGGLKVFTDQARGRLRLLC